MRKAVVVLAFGFLVGPGSAQDAAEELAKLEGTWSMVSGQRDGQVLSPLVVKNSRRVAKNSETTVTVVGMLVLKAKYTIDPSKKPKAIDYMVTGGPNEGKTQLGIYEFSGNTVKFCTAAPGMARPADFTANEGSGRTLSVWKLSKKK